MKKRKTTNTEKSRQYRKHPIGRRLIVGLLCVCLSLVSLPIDHYGYRLWASEKEKWEVVEFSLLSEDVRRQMVFSGTSQKELNLPKELEAVCRPVEVVQSLEESSETSGLPEESGLSEGTVPSAPSEDMKGLGLSLEEQESEVPEGAGESDPFGEAEGTESTGQESAVPSGEGVGTENPDGSGETQSPEGVTDPSEQATESPEEVTDPSEQVPESPEGTDIGQVETFTIEDVTWNSEPEYDKKVEGSYIFTPVLPETYSLAEGVQLPEIVVSVASSGRGEDEEISKREEEGQKKKKIRAVESIELQSEEAEPLAEPGCGIISEDTVWPGNVTLADGELVVEPGVTLTIQGIVTVQGNVTIRGGGTIVRGSGDAYFKAWDGVHLTVADITLDGASLSAKQSIIEAVRSDVILDDGCIIQNCTKSKLGPQVNYIDGNGNTQGTSGGGGAALFLSAGTAVFNDIVLENNCSTVGYSGAVFILNGELRVYGGLYKNNRAQNHSLWGVGCLYNIISKFYIYGGRFIGNSSDGRGGCLGSTGDKGTETYLYGGYFEGNKSTASGYEGSGAFYYSAFDGRPGVNREGAILDISGNVQFCEDDIQGSGMDGIYLDLSSEKDVARKIQISSTLRYPVTLYLRASEGYVIAEGTNEYMLLHERDMKKINFVDVGGSGKQWYAVLDKEKNQVYLSENKPDYGYYVYYISNGAQGTVVDDAKGGKGYAIGEKATVQSAEPLSREGWYFKEWNTQADGKGDDYQPGELLEIQGDTDLYAIFEKGKKLSADFYSGSAGQKETKNIELDISEKSGKITAPYLAAFEEMEGWTAVGWDLNPEGYAGKTQPGDKITLTENKEYYGIYEKGVSLGYDAKGAEQGPATDTRPRYASVQKEKVSYAPAKFTVAPGPVRPGYIFAGWSTGPDGSGEVYHEGDTLETDEDTTLYAMFEKTLTVNFYSGGQCQKDTRTASVTGDSSSGTVETPELRELEGFGRMGWSADISGYEAQVGEKTALTLTENADYYGIYGKDVTLAYAGEGVERSSETKSCRANVHDTVSFDRPVFTLLPAPAREGYIFRGWSTEAGSSTSPDNGKGTGGRPALYPAGSRQEFTEDTTLYASWERISASYRVEHYIQETEGDGYVLAESDTEELSGMAGDTVKAEPRNYTGFTENPKHALRRASGKIEADGSLVLRLYYDRNVYHVDFDVNGGSGEAPEAQSVRYGGLLQTVEAPVRAGYNFKGWYLDKAGSSGKQWDFARTVEENTDKGSVTLYAKWADETAPVLGKALYGKGRKNLFDWILHRESLKITVPLTEEGSGVKQAEYMLAPEKEAERKGDASLYTPVYAAIGVSPGAVSPAGTIQSPRKGRARIVTRDGQAVAEFTISEDFKGTVSMAASDWVGNVSAEKTLTAKGGGVIVEDNAPDIRFTQDPKGQYDGVTEVGVEISDAADGKISGGIAGVSYQVDGGKEVPLPGKAFREGIVESYWFTMKVSGAGSHSLRVKAVDNAGNESSRQVTVDIRGKGLPPGPEPKTGDMSHVEIYATASMIAGFTYLLLYFREHGMSEEKKEELVSRLVGWAKGKGGIRRLAALVLIFLLLAYYHSIGKDVPEDVNVKRELDIAH